MQDIRASLERVRERIARAAGRAGRRAEDVLLIGVSKAVEPVRILEAVAAGVPALGENRVQEARAKIAELGRAVPWRSEEHTSELQSRENLVCRLLLEKKKRKRVSKNMPAAALTLPRPYQPVTIRVPSPH